MRESEKEKVNPPDNEARGDHDSPYKMRTCRCEDGVLMHNNREKVGLRTCVGAEAHNR